MHDASSVAVSVVKALEDAGIPCAIGGALAYGYWVRPRSTLDADINVFVDEDQYELVLDTLVAIGVVLDRDECLARFKSGNVAIARFHGIRLDLFVPSIPFYDDARQRVHKGLLDNVEVPFLSAETLAVFKLLFFRRKDLRDLETLVEELGDDLDARWVRDKVAEMMGDEDERVVEWDRITNQ